jgi:hypothetical protein
MKRQNKVPAEAGQSSLVKLENVNVAADLVQLSPVELRAYLELRLSGRKVPPSIDTRSGEDEQDVIIRTWHLVETDHSFQRTVKEFLIGKLWQGEMFILETPLISRVLFLVDEFKLVEAKRHLISILQSEKALYKGVASLYFRDVLLQILVVLSSLQSGDELVNVWPKYLADPEYAAAAYSGLINLGFNQAVGTFPKLLEIAEKWPSQVPLRQILVHLVHRFGDKNIIYMLFVRTASEPVSGKRLLYNTIKTIPSIANIVETEGKILELEQSTQKGTSSLSAIETVERVKRFANWGKPTVVTQFCRSL